MKSFVLAFAVCLATVAAAGADEQDAGPTLMERGAQLFLEGLLKEMEPAFDELSELADGIGPRLHAFAIEMGPKLREILDQVEDWSVYEAPEMLPNGDIIIRRKPDTQPDVPADPAPQVEL